MIDDNPKVLIMMATYNGEQHIKRQIESIVSQNYTNWILVIQDDDSTDNTVSIILDFVKKDRRIKLVHNSGTFHGAYYNFHSLANRVKSFEKFEFYMFADQDDYWYSDKIQTFITLSKKMNEDVPTMLYADMRVIDGKGNVLHDSMNASYHIDIVNEHNEFINHRVFGCNTFMNKALFQLVPKVDIYDDHVKTLSHDNYYAKYAIVFGQLQYVDIKTMDFVRHGKNTTSQQQYSPTLKRFYERLFNINDLAKAHANWYRQSLYTICVMENNFVISGKMLEYINEQKKLIITGGLEALMYKRKYNINWGTKVETTSRMLILFLGLYKKYL